MFVLVSVPPSLCNEPAHKRSLGFLFIPGTLDYLAPEIVRGDVYNHRVDHWAVGILCYKMLVGHPHFQEQGFTATTSNIECLKYDVSDGFCPLARDFISKVSPQIG